ncbi:hypothetical protein V8C44DRAFT_322287 [Trichoderma aethiopicum]
MVSVPFLSCVSMLLKPGASTIQVLGTSSDAQPMMRTKLVVEKTMLDGSEPLCDFQGTVLVATIDDYLLRAIYNNCSLANWNWHVLRSPFHPSAACPSPAIAVLQSAPARIGRRGLLGSLVIL